MKRCPRCGRTFDDRLGFCEHDATPLVSVSGPPAPPSLGPPQVPVPPPQSPPAPPSYVPPTPAGSRPPSPVLLAGAAVALLAVVGGGVYLALSRSGPPRPAVDVAPPSSSGAGVEPASDPVAAVPAVPAPAADVRYADAPGDGFVALRSAPSTRQGSRAGVVPHGEAVTVLNANGPGDVIEGRPGQWMQVRYGTTVGWAFSAFLRTADAPTAPPGTVSVGAWATVYEPKDGWLNLRDGPSARTNVLVRMDNGVQVFIRYCRPDVVRSPGGRPGRWCVVDFGGTAGWAFDAYLVRS